MYKIISKPALKDNYIHLIHCQPQNSVIAIDPSIAEPVFDYLIENNARLDFILNTHHHNDHIGGNDKLKEKTGVKIIASIYDQHRIPNIDLIVKEHDHYKINDLEFRVMFIPGHTSGHIAFYFSALKALFCGDTLFSLGCGRLFEGTPTQMFESLSKIKNLASDTLIYCGHEYTLNNAKFALTIEPDNVDLQNKFKEIEKLRASGMPTIPSTLESELATNPFLRTDSAIIRKNLNMEQASDIEVFAEIRSRKDSF